jgi:hypothetical protein
MQNEWPKFLLHEFWEKELSLVIKDIVYRIWNDSPTT